MWFAAKSALRCLVALPSYFGRRDRLGISLTNLLIAVRRFGETTRYFATFSELPNYTNPQRYSEKIQWRKLFDRSPELAVFSDKLAAREWALARCPDLRASEILWVGRDPDAIPFPSLEPPFVVKPNNRSRERVVVRSRHELDEARIRSECQRWLRSPPYGKSTCEWAYSATETAIIVERLLSPLELRPRSVKIFVFHGRAQYIWSGSAVYSPTWERYRYDRWIRRKQRRPPERQRLAEEGPAPQSLSAMVRAAETIAAHIDHLRVDFYEVDGEAFFGELTAYPNGGHFMWIDADEIGPGYPAAKIDAQLGEFWQLPKMSPMAMLQKGVFGRS